MTTFATQLDKADNPVGLGLTFLLIAMAFVVLFIVLVLLGEMRNKNKPRGEPIREGVLRTEDRERERRSREKGL